MAARRALYEFLGAVKENKVQQSDFVDGRVHSLMGRRRNGSENTWAKERLKCADDNN